MRKLIVGFWGILWITGVLGQGTDLVYHNFTALDGLPSSEVYPAIEDREGFMWFCTNHGVCKFDGFNFELFNLERGLTDEVILSVYKDYRDRLWFIGFNGTLSYYDGDSITPYQYNEFILSYFRGSKIN